MSDIPSQASRFDGIINEDMTLANVFEQLAINQKHGWLYLKYPPHEVCLYFQGDLVGLVTLPEEKLQFIPEKLLHADKLPEEAYQMVIAAEEPFAALEEVVDEIEIDEVLNNICYDEICSLFIRTEGQFEFIDHNHPDADPTLSHIGRLFESEGILIEATNRQQEWHVVYSQLPEQEEILAINDPDIEGSVVSTEDPIQSILLLADRRSVQEIMLFSYFGEFDTAQILGSLFIENKLRLLEEEELRAYAAEFEAKEDWGKAIAYYRVLLKRNPFDTSVCSPLASCYEKTKYAGSLATLFREIAHKLLDSPEKEHHTQGGFYLQKFFSMLEDTPEGIEARLQLFDLVLQGEVDANALEYNQLAEGKALFQCLRKAREDLQARAVLEKLLALYPHDTVLQSQYINICLDLNDKESAVEQYENIAKIYERDNNLEELEATYQKILKLTPKRKDIVQKFKALQARTGKRVITPMRIVVAAIIVGLVGSGGWFGYSKWQAGQQRLYQQEIAKLLFKPEDFGKSQIITLRKSALKKRLSTSSQSFLDNYDGTRPSEILRMKLATDFNNLIQQNRSLYEENLFTKAKLSPAIQKLMAENPRGKKLIALNKKLLQEALKNDEIFRVDDDERQKNKRAGQLLFKAVEAKKRQDWPETRRLLQEVRKIHPSDESKQQQFEKMWREVTKVYQNFQNKLSQAQIWKKQGKYSLATRVYMEVWNDPRFLKMPARRDIKLPIYFQVTPASTIIRINDKIVDDSTMEKKIIECSPDFGEIEISAEGYSSKYFYNSLKLISPRPKNIQGKVHHPIQAKNYLHLQKALLWAEDVERGVIEGTPCYHQERLYIASRNGRIYAYKNISALQAPELVWKCKSDAFTSFTCNPCWYQGILYIGGNDVFYAIDTNRGKVIARYRLSRSTFIHSSPVVSEKHRQVMFGANDGYIYSLPLIQRRTSWNLLWKHPTRSKIETGLALINDTVIACNKRGILHAFHIARQQNLWRLRVRTPVKSTPTIYKSRIYIGGGANFYQVALNRRGSIIAKGEMQGNIYGKALIVNDVAYLGTDAEKIYAINLVTRKKLWEYSTKGAIKTAPIMNSLGTLFIGTQKGILYAIAQEGKFMWQYNIGAEILASPVLVGDVLIQGADKLYGFLDN